MSEQRLEEIDASILKTWIDNNQAVLVDVREANEYAAERIGGARLVPLSDFKAAQVPRDSGRKIVVQCEMGNRSRLAGRQLLAAGFDHVYNLEGGLQSWKRAGYETECDPGAPIAIMRQVQIVAGTLVLAGTVLGATVSPWFLLLSGFVGAGLAFAGITNTCGMALLLSKLPYNKRT